MKNVIHQILLFLTDHVRTTMESICFGQVVLSIAAVTASTKTNGDFHCSLAYEFT